MVELLEGPIGADAAGIFADAATAARDVLGAITLAELIEREQRDAGGAMYHQAPSPGAPELWAESRSWPHDGANGSPSPMNARLVSTKTALILRVTRKSTS